MRSIKTSRFAATASLFSAVAALLMTGAMTSHAAEYNIDGAHSDVVFKVRHMGISTVTGSFAEVSGSFNVDPKNVAATTGSAVVKVASINTNNAKRDGHLKSDDFFNAEQFPEIKFVSKSVRNVNLADSTADLVGDLTIRDVTKEIVLKVKGTGILAKDPWGMERAAFKASGVINRFDFNLKWNSLLEGGGFVVAPEVELVLSFEGVRPAGAPAASKTPAKAAKKK
jgi:polyisoprenoid-binding protein YceI